MSVHTNYWLQWSDSGHVKDLLSISFYFPCDFLKKIDNVHRRTVEGKPAKCIDFSFHSALSSA